MSRVGLDLQALARLPDNAIQDSDGLVVLGTTTKPAANLNVELVVDVFVDGIQITVASCAAKVVPVDD